MMKTIRIRLQNLAVVAAQGRIDAIYRRVIENGEQLLVVKNGQLYRVKTDASAVLAGLAENTTISVEVE